MSKLNDALEASLEAQADELLSAVPGVYTEQQLSRKIRDSLEQLERTPLQGECSEMDNIIAEAFWGDVKDSANKMGVDIVDVEMIEMRSKGMTFAEIAKEKKVSRYYAERHIKKTQQRIMKNELFGLWEVIMAMTACLQSSWWRIFAIEILAREKH